MNNKPKTKLLTISLLCCGRAETTERCLKSLMPIREAIDSELQVVDTGCQPDTRAVIEKYADEIFEFTWCNDFAAARNFQLDQANGKMFLFIDDDEFFLDCKYIIEFFNQPDCTKYNIGGYFQRNYLDFEGKEYDDIEVVRMCSVTPETVFKGKIHEYIEPAYGNAMFMDARAGHFGYVYKTEQDNINHSLRNIPLLKEMMEEEPDNLRWPYQLAQEYRAIKYFNELYDVCHDGFYHSFDIDEPESIRYRGPFAAGMIIALLENGKDDEVLKLYEDQLKKDDILEIPKATLAIRAARVMFIRDMNEECEKAANLYLDTYERYGKDRGQMFMQGGIFINDTFDENHMNMMYCYLMTCGMRRNDFGPLTHYYRRLSWNSVVVRINRGFVSTLVLKAAELGYRQELKDALNKFFIRPGFRDILQHEIDENAPQLSKGELENVKKCFRGTDGQKEMYQFLDILLLEKELIEKEWSGIDEAFEQLSQYVSLIDGWFALHKLSTEEGEAALDVVSIAGAFNQFFDMSDKDPAQALTILKNVMGTRPRLDGMISQLSKLYGKFALVLKAKEDNLEKFNEMYALEEAVLKQIAELDAAGRSSEAVSTYKQLVGILESTFGVDTLHV